MLKPAAKSDGFPSSADVKEAGRLEALDRYDLMDTPREEAFDRVVRLVKRLLDVPVAYVSLIDGHRQWYKACTGLPGEDSARSDTFCTYTIEQDEPVVVSDARKDSRFFNNPFVTPEVGVRAYAGIPLSSMDGFAIGTLCAVDYKPREFSRDDVDLLNDLARIVMTELELRRTAAVDSLTGALSRKAFKDSAARELSLAQRHRYSVSCIAMDIDHFKSINDRFGHAAGDTVLVATAKTVHQHMRQTDLFGRLGGEEFVVLLPHTGRASALEAAEKLRGLLERQTFHFGGDAVQVTSSFGVAALDLATRDLEALLAHADAALYESKNTGRNKVTAWRHKDGEGRIIGRRVLKAGLILFNGRRSTVDCTVRSLADDGAGMDVSSTMGIPDTFELRLSADSETHACRVVARTEKHFDVIFR